MQHFIRQQITKSRSYTTGLNFALKSHHVRQQHRHSSSAARKGFGSFHSEDVEVLIRQGDDVYIPPSIHNEIIFQLKEKNDNIIGSFDFGRRAKKGLFVIDDDWTFINHGAFGATLQPLLDESNLWRNMCESQPLRFYDRYLLPMVAYSVRETAKFINCPAEELVPLQNVTSGLNSIINSVPLIPGDEMVCLSITYGSTKKIMKDACVRSGATLKIVDISLPIISAESVVTLLSKALNDRTKLVILDQITSNTAMILPIADMAQICKEAGAVVVIDAAHALFSQDVSIYNADQNLLWNHNVSSKIKDNDTSKNDVSERRNSKLCIADFADVWITNAHKWMCAPKGCAFMWISPRMTGKIRPAVISHGYTPSNKKGFENYVDNDRLLSSYSWDGCRDYSSLLTMPSTISLWEQLSHHLSQKSDNENSINSNRISNIHDSRTDKIMSIDDIRRNDTKKNTDLSILRDYNKQILINATESLSRDWCVIESDFAGPKDMRENSPMILIPLPYRLNGVATNRDATDNEAFALQEMLHHEHMIEVPIKCLEGRLYARLSSHVYNVPEDYHHLSNVIKKLM